MNNKDYAISYKDGTVFINVPLIWQDSRTVENFIDNFSRVVHHEELHKVIYETYLELGLSSNWEIYLDYEEELVRDLSNTTIDVFE